MQTNLAERYANTADDEKLKTSSENVSIVVFVLRLARLTSYWVMNSMDRVVVSIRLKKCLRVRRPQHPCRPTWIDV